MRAGSNDAFAITVCTRESLESALVRLDELSLEIDDRQTLSDAACRLACRGDFNAAMQWLDSSRDSLDGIDIWMEPIPTAVRKLLICDMDMTIVAAETLDEVAASLGLGDEIATITTRAMHGEIDFNQALRQRIAMLAGRDESVFVDLVPKMKLNPGAEALIGAAREQGVHTILVSGGFSQVAEAIGQSLDFDEVVCNRLALEDGKLTGEVLDPIVNAQYKLDLLKRRVPLKNCA